jgi:hypothetical protein
VNIAANAMTARPNRIPCLFFMENSFAIRFTDSAVSRRPPTGDSGRVITQTVISRPLSPVGFGSVNDETVYEKAVNPDWEHDGVLPEI